MLKRPHSQPPSLCLGAAVKYEAAIWYHVHKSGNNCEPEDSKWNRKACLCRERKTQLGDLFARIPEGRFLQLFSCFTLLD